jgi:gas vesicle protein
MARDRVYKVVIDGEEYVSNAAKEAGDGMDKFTGKKDGWIKSFTDLKAAWDVVASAAKALFGVAMDSLDAFDEYESSMRRLEGTAKITGTPLATLTDLATAAKREFGLSSVQANDYATAVNNLATKAGYAGDKQELLAAMLDLGAAKGLTAAESLQAFEQSILGIDEGTDKLFGKNPSGLWADYAEQIGKSPGKMSDLEKSLVLVYATMDAGKMVQGSYSEWLNSSAGQTQLLSSRINDAKVKFGEILSPIRLVVVQGLNAFADSLGTGTEGLDQLKAALTLIAQNLVGTFLTAWQTFGPAVIAILQATVAGVMLFGDAFRALVVGVQKGVGEIVDKIGWLVSKGGGILKAFGIDMVADWGDTMQEWGKKTSGAADESWAKFRQESSAAWAAVTRDAQTAAPAAIAPITQIGDAANKALGTDVVNASKQAGDAVRANLGPTVQDLLGVTEQSMKDLAKTASTTLEPAKAKDFNAEMATLVTKSHEVRDRLMGWTPEIEKATGKGKDLAREVGTLARGALDLAQSFGVVDAQAASLLNSVVSIATALPKALAGDLTSIGGIIGGVANIARQIIGGDAERKKLMRDNTRQLERLTKEVGSLRLNVTGEQFQGVKEAIGSVIGQLGGGRGARNQADIVSALRQRGLSLSDLEKVANELGIKIKTDSGAISVDGIRQLFEAMGMTEFGQFGTGFGDRLESTTRGFDINKTSTQQQIANLFGLGAEFAPALRGIFDASDLAGTRARLRNLFQGMVDGTIGAAGFGGLTGSEFLDLITDLIGRIDTVIDSGTGNAPVADGEVVPTGATSPGTAPSPALTLADVFRDYASDSIPLFQQQIALQTRIADATEATATNTASTVNELRALRETIASGVLRDGLDEALEAERYALAVQQGAAVTF